MAGSRRGRSSTGSCASSSSMDARHNQGSCGRSRSRFRSPRHQLQSLTPAAAGPLNDERAARVTRTPRTRIMRTSPCGNQGTRRPGTCCGRRWPMAARYSLRSWWDDAGDRADALRCVRDGDLGDDGGPALGGHRAGRIRRRSLQRAVSPRTSGLRWRIHFADGAAYRTRAQTAAGRRRRPRPGTSCRRRRRRSAAPCRPAERPSPAARDNPGSPEGQGVVALEPAVQAPAEATATAARPSAREPRSAAGQIQGVTNAAQPAPGNLPLGGCVVDFSRLLQGHGARRRLGTWAPT